jgi:tRNA1Val (adenine37-N6)-methyltransferase
VSRGRAVTEGRVSEDTLFGGRLALVQPAQGTGYRTNVDAILLADFAADGARKIQRAVDLGAGVGAVGLSLLILGATQRVDFIERDPFLADLCQRNLEANGWMARGSVHVADLDAPRASFGLDIDHAANLVVANPPYVAPQRDGRVRSERQPAANRLASRQGELSPFVRAAATLLGRRGRACFIYPAHALLELTTLARQAGLEPKRIRFVHGKAKRPARVVLVELARAKPGGLVVVPPLFEVGEDGKPTPDLAALLATDLQRVVKT